MSSNGLETIAANAPENAAIADFSFVVKSSINHFKIGYLKA
jgi:hypothetical protein